jgi:hypothetical protein
MPISAQILAVNIAEAKSDGRICCMKKPACAGFGEEEVDEPGKAVSLRLILSAYFQFKLMNS